jgi:hypothetical protein
MSYYKDHEENIWERMQYLFENDEEFKYKISLAAEKDAAERGVFDKDYYNDMCNEYLASLHDSMIDNLEDKIPYLDDDIIDYAYLIAKIDN